MKMNRQRKAVFTEHLNILMVSNRPLFTIIIITVNYWMILINKSLSLVLEKSLIFTKQTFIFMKVILKSKMTINNLLKARKINNISSFPISLFWQIKIPFNLLDFQFIFTQYFMNLYWTCIF